MWILGMRSHSVLVYYVMFGMYWVLMLYYQLCSMCHAHWASLDVKLQHPLDVSGPAFSSLSPTKLHLLTY